MKWMVAKNSCDLKIALRPTKNSPVHNANKKSASVIRAAKRRRQRDAPDSKSAAIFKRSQQDHPGPFSLRRSQGRCHRLRD
jgi:hypothetical protein